MSVAPAQSRRRLVAILFSPSLLLIAPLLFYWHFGGVRHFLLHALMGWDVGLILLLGGRISGLRPRTWKGFLPAGLAFVAMTPDFIYVLGPYHRDWMDIFLFHVSLDEILPYAIVVEALLWLGLVVSYMLYRDDTVRSKDGRAAGERQQIQSSSRLSKS